MQWLTALFLSISTFYPGSVCAQETVQDWSKKVIELQEKEGQNFEQDIQLVKGFLYLQRRNEALSLLSRLLKSSNKKDSRLAELYETASEQFFLQDTAELYADVVQLIREESWQEAKDKVEAGLQKENKQKLLTLRGIQLGLIMNQNDLLTENSKTAESFYPDFIVWKIYSAWINLGKNDAKEAYRVLSNLWASDRRMFENNEVLVLVYLQAIDQTKHPADWAGLSKIIQKHPEWVGVRLWRLKNKSFAAADRKREITQLTEIFADLKKLKDLREKEAKENSYYYNGFISLEKTKTQFEELISKPSGTN